MPRAVPRVVPLHRLWRRGGRSTSAAGGSSVVNDLLSGVIKATNNGGAGYWKRDECQARKKANPATNWWPLLFIHPVANTQSESRVTLHSRESSPAACTAPGAPPDCLAGIGPRCSSAAAPSLSRPPPLDTARSTPPGTASSGRR